MPGLESSSGVYLTRLAAAVHDALVQRVICFALATVIFLWLPARCIAAGDPGPVHLSSSSEGSSSAQTEQPAQATDFGPRMIQGSAGSWQARLAHDALAIETHPPKLAIVRVSVRFSAARLRVHAAQPHLTFPLLI